MVQARLNMMIGVLASLIPSAANAEEALGWYGEAGEHGASLFYGVPESDHAPLSFSCERGDTDLAFVFAFDPVNVSAGDKVEVLLQAGDLEVPIVTTLVLIEMDNSFILKGRTVLDARLADLITSRGTLTIFTEDGAEELPLEGAREAATGLIATCAARTGEVIPPQTVSCAISAWSTDPDPTGLNVRAAPTSDATIIGNLPAAREVGGERFATEVSITGSKDGWLRISEGWVLDYIFDDPIEIVFKGEGWVPGRHLGLLLNHRYLYGGPSSGTSIVATLAGKTNEFRYGPDSFLVDRIHSCRGGWVEVEGAMTVDGTTYGPALRGWTTSTCSNQVTTCP